MLRHILFLYISLQLCSLEVLSFGPNRWPTFDPAKPLPSQYIIAPEIGMEIGGVNFAVADYEMDESSKHLRVNLRIQGKNHRYFNECKLKLKTRQGTTKSGLSSLRRLPDSYKVVFTWYDEMNNSDRRVKIVAMDVSDCSTNDLELGDMINNPIVVPSTAGRFYLFIDDSKYCKGVGNRCVLSYYYKRSFRSFDQPKLLDVDFEWSTLDVQVLQNQDLVVRGFENDNTYKAILIDRSTAKKTTMITISNIDRQLKVVSSGLSMCYVKNPSVDKKVHCSQFTESGQLISSLYMEYSDAVTPMFLRKVSDSNSVIVLGKTQCKNDDCWKLKVSNVLRDENSRDLNEEINFTCNGDRKDLMIFYAKEKDKNLGVNYACRKDNNYLYNVTNEEAFRPGFLTPRLG